MKRVLLCFKMPHGNDYVGGIAVILKQYIENKDLFYDNEVDAELFDFSDDSVKCSNRHLRTLLLARRAAGSLARTIKQNNIDIVHIHTSRQLVLLKDVYIASEIKKHCNVEIIFSIHYGDADKILPGNGLLKKYCISGMKKYVDRIIFLSEQTKKEFDAILGTDVGSSVLYTFHNVDMPAERLQEKTEAIKNKDKTGFLFIGSIDRRKGIIDLLKACTQLKDDSYILHICGGEPDADIKEEYRALINRLGDRVIEHGYVSGAEKERVFLASDVMILPSYGEGMPIVIMEAMAYAQGMILTKVGAIPEIIEERENALYVTPGNTDELAAAMSEMINDKTALTAMAENNIRKSRDYDIRSNIKNLCDIYKGNME